MTVYIDGAARIVTAMFATIAVIPHPTLRVYLENMIRDEVDAARREAVADRRLPDA